MPTGEPSPKKPIPWGAGDAFSLPPSAAPTRQHPRTQVIPAPAPQHTPLINPDYIRRQLRSLGITEEVFIHEQDYNQFLEEKGIQELGRGGEGAVYFLRGHVTKLVNEECAPAALRELAHMLHLNRISDAAGTMGERSRQDWPAVLWVYALSNGALSIGMKPFDNPDSPEPGSTLYERLNYGPAIPREQMLRDIRDIAQSLLYSQRKGIIHHDLKPANIYIPSDPNQSPVVFDLGQALWQQSAWGKKWLKHEHNFHYWYNGTYRYMHHLRRLAHLAALAQAENAKGTPEQLAAFEVYVPSNFDDVISFARILRDIVQSKFSGLTPEDRAALRAFYQDILGIRRIKSTPANEGSGIIKRLRSLVGGGAPPPASTKLSLAELQQKWASMEQVVPALEKTISSLMGGDKKRA